MAELTDRLTAALADRYELGPYLGEGGMATVYLACDLKHERSVALKVLKPNYSAVLGGERFLHEIKITANLQHPNILPLYDSGEADELLFYVMPYVEGGSLRVRMDRESRLPVDQTVAIVTDVAAALHFAHERGIVHRDIKPENILLQGGRPLVADFGIALAVSQMGKGRLTEPGTSLGTPHYMSPEAVGEAELDARSDVYALGAVTYEMLVGEPPHDGRSAQAIIAKHLSDPAPSARRLRDAIPVGIDRAVTRALAKTPADRFDTALAFSDALRTTGGALESKPPKSIVVVPFANVGAGSESEYFSDGLTEEIISDLSRIRECRVISRSSAMQLKGTDKDVKTIGCELNVRYVLDGSVRQAGESLRVTAQLIDTTTDTSLWSDKYTGTTDDVFDIQERISRMIVDALAVELSPEEDRGIAARPLDNVPAYQCYLQARAEIYRFSDTGFDRAIQLIRKGLDIVGDNELLWATLGHVYVEQMVWGVEVDEQHLRRVDECIAKVFELDPQSTRGYALSGMVQYKKGDRVESARLLHRVLAEDPGDADAMLWLTSLYCRAGRSDLGRPLAERLRHIDPLTPLNQLWPAYFDFLDGAPPATLLAPLRRVYEMDPDNPLSLHNFAWTLIVNEHRSEALTLFDRLAAEFPNTGFGPLGRVYGLALRGEAREASQAVTDELVRWAQWDDGSSWYLAECYALIGETDEALRWLENAVRLGSPNYPMYSRCDPLLENLRDDERFHDLMRVVKREWERFGDG